MLYDARFVCVNNTPSYAVWRGGGGATTEIQNTAGDGSGDVTFTNPAADVYVAVVITGDTSASINLPTPSASPRFATIVIDATSVGPASGYVNVSIGLPVFATTESVVSAPIYWNGSAWNAVGLSTADANSAARNANLEFTLNFSTMPVIDPHLAGQMWNNSGTATISSG